MSCFRASVPRYAEALLSRCRLAESFVTGDDKTQISGFIEVAEAIIVSSTDVVVADHPLPMHTEFLRRTARRSKRKARAKIFTTNYDRCFEEAGRQGRYVVVDGFSHAWPPTFDAVHFTHETVRRLADTEALDLIPNVFHLYKLMAPGAGMSATRPVLLAIWPTRRRTTSDLRRLSSGQMRGPSNQWKRSSLSAGSVARVFRQASRCLRFRVARSLGWWAEGRGDIPWDGGKSNSVGTAARVPNRHRSIA